MFTFPPRHQKVSKMSCKRVLGGASLALKMEKVPSKRASKKHIKHTHRKISKNIEKRPKHGHVHLSFLGTFLMIFSWGASTPENHAFFDKNHRFFIKTLSFWPIAACEIIHMAPQVPTNWRGGTQACLLNIYIYVMTPVGAHKLWGQQGYWHSRVAHTRQTRRET